MTNNNEWQKENIDLEKIRENLKNPTLIDNANIEYNSENNNNIEQTETFEGGQENLDKFKELMKAVSAEERLRRLAQPMGEIQKYDDECYGITK